MSDNCLFCCQSWDDAQDMVDQDRQRKIEWLRGDGGLAVIECLHQRSATTSFQSDVFLQFLEVFSCRVDEEPAFCNPCLDLIYQLNELEESNGDQHLIVSKVIEIKARISRYRCVEEEPSQPTEDTDYGVESGEKEEDEAWSFNSLPPSDQAILNIRRLSQETQQRSSDTSSAEVAFHVSGKSSSLNHPDESATPNNMDEPSGVFGNRRSSPGDVEPLIIQPDNVVRDANSQTEGINLQREECVVLDNSNYNNFLEQVEPSEIEPSDTIQGGCVLLKTSAGSGDLEESQNPTNNITIENDDGRVCTTVEDNRTGVDGGGKEFAHPTALLKKRKRIHEILSSSKMNLFKCKPDQKDAKNLRSALFYAKLQTSKTDVGRPKNRKSFQDSFLRSKSTAPPKSNSKGSSASKCYPCNTCGRKFSRLDACQRHGKRSYSNIFEYKCSQCSAQFKNKCKFSHHIRRCHDREKRISCSFAECQRKFYSLQELQRHKAHRHGSVEFFKFRCLFCDKLFVVYSLLEMHMVSHTREKPFSCKRCDISYSTKAAFRRHQMEWHILRRIKDSSEDDDNNRSISNNRDSRTTLFKTNLVAKHVNSHTCRICGKQQTYGNRTRHERSHSSKPFICPENCGYRSTTKQNVMRHLAARHRK